MNAPQPSRSSIYQSQQSSSRSDASYGSGGGGGDGPPPRPPYGTIATVCGLLFGVGLAYLNWGARAVIVVAAITLLLLILLLYGLVMLVNLLRRVSWSDLTWLGKWL